MAYVVFRDGVTTVTIRYVELKPNGSFQYRRCIPLDVQANYNGRRFFVRSLKRDRNKLALEASRITAQLDAEWATIRGSSLPAQGSKPPEAFYVPAHAFIVEQPTVSAPTILLSQALELYVAHHPKGKLAKFRSDNDRVIGFVIQAIGNLPIHAYTRQHAEQVRDKLLLKNTTGSVRRRLNSITAIFNKARKEKQLQIVNPFEGLGIARERQDSTSREPFTMQELAKVAAACRKLDDDIRHIVALQMDTGARLAEIVGLRRDDVILDHEVPHVRIRPYGSVRTLKTPASERDVPLVGEALWAARRALEAHRKHQDGDQWLFGRYAADHEIKATHASNTLNKWLRSVPGLAGHKTTHCFRHAMRDRMRAAQVPHDIQEAIGGWGSRTVGQGYGRGYSLQVLWRALLLID